MGLMGSFLRVHDQIYKRADLQANPAVELQVGRERMAAQAAVIGHSDPRFERLWKIVNANNRDRYSVYQGKTPGRYPSWR